jgi:hypothetical protein
VARNHAQGGSKGSVALLLEREFQTVPRKVA